MSGNGDNSKKAMKKNMKNLLVGCAVSLACGITTAAVAENAAEIGSVRLKGYLGERLDAMIERHVVGTDVDYITAPFLLQAFHAA